MRNVWINGSFGPKTGNNIFTTICVWFITKTSFSPKNALIVNFHKEIEYMYIHICEFEDLFPAIYLLNIDDKVTWYGHTDIELFDGLDTREVLVIIVRYLYSWLCASRNLKISLRFESYLLTVFLIKFLNDAYFIDTRTTY